MLGVRGVEDPAVKRRIFLPGDISVDVFLCKAHEDATYQQVHRAFTDLAGEAG